MGHLDLRATEIYAERDSTTAANIMREIRLIAPRLAGDCLDRDTLFLILQGILRVAQAWS